MEPIKRYTKTEIIEQTVSFYSADPVGRRARDRTGNAYYYKHPTTGNKCAVGRCMSNPQNWSGYCTNLGPNVILEDELMPEYKGHEQELWRDLQHLHDNNQYWTEVGISQEGQEYADKLLNTYKDQ